MLATLEHHLVFFLLRHRREQEEAPATPNLARHQFDEDVVTASACLHYDVSCFGRIAGKQWKRGKEEF